MMLGNLSVEQMERRMGIVFPDDLKKVLAKYHQNNVATDIKPGYWHCFDIPFTMVCGNTDLAELVQEKLTPLVDKIVTPLSVMIVNTEVGYTRKST